MDAPVTGFSHVQLLVTDVERSEHWYTTVLGVERLTAGDGYVALRHREGRFVVVLTAGEPTFDGAGPLDHLAFAVPDGEVLGAWADRLRTSGIDHDGVVLELGKPSLQLRDPDGNAVELVAPPRRGS